MENETTNTLKLDTGRKFKINFTKVTSVEDVVEILKSMDLTIFWYDGTIPEKFKYLFDNELLIEVVNN